MTYLLKKLQNTSKYLSKARRKQLNNLVSESHKWNKNYVLLNVRKFQCFIKLNLLIVNVVDESQRGRNNATEVRGQNTGGLLRIFE